MIARCRVHATPPPVPDSLSPHPHQATCAQLGVSQSYVLARGGPPGVMATSAVAGQPDAPPEGLVEVTVPSLQGGAHRSGATDMSF